MAKTDFDIPENLPRDVKRAAKAIVAVIRETFGKDASGGGCRLFYTAEEWRERGESYGTEAALIVVHDGGDAAPFFNHDYMNYELMEKMRKLLEAVGFWVEACTCWYDAIYRLEAK
jgi:hypothetical protein